MTDCLQKMVILSNLEDNVTKKELIKKVLDIQYHLEVFSLNKTISLYSQ